MNHQDNAPVGHVRIDSGEVHIVPKVRDTQASQLKDGQQVYASPVVQPAASEPPRGLLVSMAIRYDHGLGCPGFYDSPMFKRFEGDSHARRLESTLGTMRQLWEEVAGHGFYRPEKEAEYAAMADPTAKAAVADRAAPTGQPPALAIKHLAASFFSGEDKSVKAAGRVLMEIENAATAWLIRPDAAAPRADDHVENLKGKLTSLRVLLADSPETREWAPSVRSQCVALVDEAIAALAVQQAQPARVFLVATGEVRNGLELYERHDTRPPLCDAEVLYSAPPAAEETISIQEAWEAAGGNPGIKATKEDLLAALKTLDQVCDESDKPTAPTALTPSAYKLPDDARIEESRQRDGTIKWAVRQAGSCLNTHGEWEYEPQPSSRDGEFLARCRWPNPEAAHQAWLAASKQ